MSAQMLWQELQRVPWTALAFQAESAVLALLVWRITVRRQEALWTKWAPYKARETIRDLQLENNRWELREKQLLEDLAEVRGQLAAVQQGLEKPEQTPLLYARGRWRQG